LVRPNLPTEDDLLPWLRIDRATEVGQFSIGNVILPGLDDLEASVFLKERHAVLGPSAIGLHLFLRNGNDKSGDVHRSEFLQTDRPVINPYDCHCPACPDNPVTPVPSMLLRLCLPRGRWLLDRPVEPGDDRCKGKRKSSLPLRSNRLARSGHRRGGASPIPAA